MKYNFKFLQTGGVPLTNDLMQLLEEAYGIFEVLGELAGNLTILAGCQTNGSNVEPGIVAIDGKLYYFEGGLAVSTVFINLEEIGKVFQDQTTKTLIEKRTVRFGNSTAPNLYNWADFVRIGSIKDIQILAESAATQSQLQALETRIDLLELKTAPIINGGVIWAWRKPANEIPAGWKECIDTRGKTLFGRDPNDSTFANLGNTIGSKTKTILKPNLPNEGIPIYVLKSTSDGWRTATGSGRPVTNINAAPYSNQFEFPELRYTANMGDGTPMDVLSPGRIVNFIEPNFQ